MKFLNFFLLLWVIFSLLDPNPHSEYGCGSTDLIESGSNTDPDPKQLLTTYSIHNFILRSSMNWGTSYRTVPSHSPDTKHKTCLLFLHHLGVGCSGGDADVTRRAALRREAAVSRDAIVGGFGLLVSTAGGFGLLGSAAGNVSLLTTARWWWLLSEPFDRADFCIRGEFTKEFFCFCIFFADWSVFATPLLMSPLLYFWEMSGFEPRELP